MPKVSVLMAVYNDQRYVREAIASILNQTWTDYEFLIVNDGSTDDTRAIITSFDDPRIRLIDNPANIGLTKSLNRGLALAQGDYIARQDSDDISHPTRLEWQVQFLDAHPDVVLLGTQIRQIDQHGNPLPERSVRPTTGIGIKWHLLFDNPFPHTSVMFRRSVVWDTLYGYNEDFIRSQDFELWSRIASTYSVCNLSEVLVDYRVHPASIQSTNNPPYDRMREVVWVRNLQQFLNLSSHPSEWARLIYENHHLTTAGTIDHPGLWITVLDMMFRLFHEQHPEAAQEKSVRAYLADQFGRLAYYYAPCNRLMSFVAWTRACFHDRTIIGRFALLRYLALLSGGETIRRVYQTIRRR